MEETESWRGKIIETSKLEIRNSNARSDFCPQIGRICANCTNGMAQPAAGEPNRMSRLQGRGRAETLFALAGPAPFRNQNHVTPKKNPEAKHGVVQQAERHQWS